MPTELTAPPITYSDPSPEVRVPVDAIVPRDKYRVVEMSFTNSMRNGEPYPWAECMSDYLNLHNQAGDKLFACYPAAERATFVFIWELPPHIWQKTPTHLSMLAKDAPIAD